MKHDMTEQDRELLVEAFRAGWQAALAIRITNPRVLAVIDSCFEEWLVEAADEVEVFGLAFRRRENLPRTTWDPDDPDARSREPPREPHDPRPRVPVAAFEESSLGGAFTPLRPRRPPPRTEDAGQPRRFITRRPSSSNALNKPFVRDGTKAPSRISGARHPGSVRMTRREPISPTAAAATSSTVSSRPPEWTSALAWPS